MTDQSLLGQFQRHFAILLSGNALASVIMIAAAPLLSRLYDPTSFGILASVMSTVSLALAAVHGRYQLAIPIAQSQNEAVALVFLPIALSLILSPILAGLIGFNFIRGGVDVNIFILIICAVLITTISAVIDIFAYWRSYRKRFKVSAQVAFVRAASTVAAQVAFSYISSAGMILGALTGSFIALVYSLFDNAKRDSDILRWPGSQFLGKMTQKYRDYPLLSMPQGFVATASWNLMPLLLFRYGGAEIAGLYWLSYRLMMAAYNLVDAAYRQVTLPLIGQSVDIDAKRLRSMLITHSMLLFSAVMAGAIILFVWGEPLFAFTFGEEWRQAGWIAAWLAVGFTAEFAKLPATCKLQADGRLASILSWEVGIMIVRYALVLVFLATGQIEASIIAFSLVGLSGWIMFSIAGLRR